ncbi:hypothetical protein XELAEV_18010755mg [Xenopus laevis]|uniref:Uncharacterized protein n=1 Tax=Xenopus laevis TaxID=8355 RepID=A0A974DW03_XENLA|nr:hypothetical protein XELAEV_18010755mg [Xenopus laevis]
MCADGLEGSATPSRKHRRGKEVCQSTILNLYDFKAISMQKSAGKHPTFCYCDHYNQPGSLVRLTYCPHTWKLLLLPNVKTQHSSCSRYSCAENVNNYLKETHDDTCSPNVTSLVSSQMGEAWVLTMISM